MSHHVVVNVCTAIVLRPRCDQPPLQTHIWGLTNVANAAPVPPSCRVTPKGQAVLDHHCSCQIVELAHTLSSAGNTGPRISVNRPFQVHCVSHPKQDLPEKKRDLLFGQLESSCNAAWSKHTTETCKASHSRLRRIRRCYQTQKEPQAADWRHTKMRIRITTAARDDASPAKPSRTNPTITPGGKDGI